MTFDAAAAKDLYSALASHAKSLKVFARVNEHAPDNAPGNGVSVSIELAPWDPYPAGSGMDATTGKISFTFQIWSSWLQKPKDGIDPQVLGALADLVASLSGDITLTGQVRNIDLMGMHAEPGYVPDFEGKPFRVINLTVPIVINDMFTQAEED